MAITLQELVDSRRVEDSCNKGTASRTFLLYDEDGSEEVSIFDAWRYCTNNDLSMGDGYPGYSVYKVNNVSIEASADRDNTWVVKADYAEGVACDPTNTLGPVSQQVSVRTEMIDVWRTNPNGNATPAGTDNTDLDSENATGQDVGGTSAGPAGLPVSFLMPYLDLVLVENTAVAPRHIDLQSAIGSRNLYNFGGAAPGTVVYRGSNSSYNAKTGLYQVSHQFTGDFRFAHMRQMAIGDPATGNVNMATANTANAGSGAGTPGYGVTQKGSAKKVVWVQRFPNLIDLNQIPLYYHF